MAIDANKGPGGIDASYGRRITVNKFDIAQKHDTDVYYRADGQLISPNGDPIFFGVDVAPPISDLALKVNEEVIFLYNGNNANDVSKPLTGLFPIADISGVGVIDHINLICTANDAFRSAQLVVFVDGEIVPSVNFQMSHFGIDYQPVTFVNGLNVGHDHMRLKLGPAPSGTSQVQVKFNYEIPFSAGVKVFIYQRQPIMKWWTEVAYRPGLSLPHRLKSKSTNNNGPTFARGGTTGFAAAASSFTSPIDNTTEISLPSFIVATAAQLKDGSISLMDVPSGKSGSIVGFSYGAFTPTSDSFSYLETNPALFSGTQKLAGINANTIATYHATGTEDFLGSSFYFSEGIGSHGDHYISQLATTDNQNGPGAAFAKNVRCVTDFLMRYQNGIEFTDGGYLTLVQSATNLVSDPGNATGNNTTTQTSISMGISLSFLTLWYEFA